MKKLAGFNRFDFRAFSHGKAYKVIGVSKWLNFETKEELGTKVSAVISKDETPYPLKDGEKVTNLYEKLDFKVPKKNVHVNIGDCIEPVNPIATIYGKFRNQLSVKCDDVTVIQTSQPTKQTQQPQQAPQAKAMFPKSLS